MAGKTCVICGEPSGMYPLCRTHLQEKNNGNVVKCEKCNTWHYVDKPCKCKKEIPVSQPKTKEEQPLCTCILCGEETKIGHHFCKKCYSKYSQKEITVHIKNCDEVTIIDEYGNKKYKNRAGVYVRSFSEKIISDELFDQNIRYAYEPSVLLIDEHGEQITLHPDFYLPDYKLYIEHWGYENDPKYEETKRFKEKLYSSKNLKVAGTTAKDLEDISAAIQRILFEFSK